MLSQLPSGCASRQANGAASPSLYICLTTFAVIAGSCVAALHCQLLLAQSQAEVHSKCTELALALQLSADVARGLVNPDCDDPASDADMEEEDWDYAYPGCEMDEDLNGAMAPRLAPPDAAPLVAPSPAPTGKACRFLFSAMIVSGTQPFFPCKY